MKQTDYKKKERVRQLKLLRNDFFEGASGGGCWKKKGKSKYYEFILKSGDQLKNLYAHIREDALDYFKRYNIAWWGKQNVNMPSGHLLSSQVHCLNHLFAISQDHDAVLAMIKPIGEAAGIQFDDVLPSFIDTKEQTPNKCFISFEFVYKNDVLLNESGVTRGTKCTSVDALVYAKAGNERWLVPIEWKYTEAYEHNMKAFNFSKYKGMVTANSRLTEWGDLFKSDPFYELGRQTLLMEKIIEKEHNEEGKPLADNFLHLIVVPAFNVEMNNDANTFINSIKDDSKKYVRIITPEQLLSPIKTQYGKKYVDLISYLENRY